MAKKSGFYDLSGDVVIPVTLNSCILTANCIGKYDLILAWEGSLEACELTWERQEFFYRDPADVHSDTCVLNTFRSENVLFQKTAYFTRQF